MSKQFTVHVVDVALAPLDTEVVLRTLAAKMVRGLKSDVAAALAVHSPHTNHSLQHLDGYDHIDTVFGFETTTYAHLQRLHALEPQPPTSASLVRAVLVALELCSAARPARRGSSNSGLCTVVVTSTLHTPTLFPPQEVAAVVDMACKLNVQLVVNQIDSDSVVAQINHGKWHTIATQINDKRGADATLWSSIALLKRWMRACKRPLPNWINTPASSAGPLRIGPITIQVSTALAIRADKYHAATSPFTNLERYVRDDPDTVLNPQTFRQGFEFTGEDLVVGDEEFAAALQSREEAGVDVCGTLAASLLAPWMMQSRDPAWVFPSEPSVHYELFVEALREEQAVALARYSPPNTPEVLVCLTPVEAVAGLWGLLMQRLPFKEDERMAVQSEESVVSAPLDELVQYAKDMSVELLPWNRFMANRNPKQSAFVETDPGACFLIKDHAKRLALARAVVGAVVAGHGSLQEYCDSKIIKGDSAKVVCVEEGARRVRRALGVDERERKRRRKRSVKPEEAEGEAKPETKTEALSTKPARNKWGLRFWSGR